MIDLALVVPTVGRPSLNHLLRSVADARRHHTDTPLRIVLVDDRPDANADPLSDAIDVSDALDIAVARSFGRGPAAARNVGAGFTTAQWIVFLDDDVHVDSRWWDDLQRDVLGGDELTAATYGRIEVPLPTDQRPTDWERNTAHLATSRWITADVAVRRLAFEDVGGFDEGFHHAYREDSDLALRLIDAGWRLRSGTRLSIHPPRPAAWHASVRSQRGNAADARMAIKHGRRFRSRLGEPRPLSWFHATTCAACALALTAAMTSRRRTSLAAVGIWAVLTGGFTARRVSPGPRNPSEIGAMAATSALIPPAALWHRSAGSLTTRWQR